MRISIIIIFHFLFYIPALCQYNGNDISIGIYGFYTTSASVFLNPNASDIVVRNKSFLIEDIWNPGVDIRFRVSEPLILGLNIEYIRITRSAPNLNVFLGGSVVPLRVDDGFKLIPVELSAYYLLPFSTEGFKFLMGGGLAYYNGEFIREIGETEVKNITKEAAFGIHVSISMDYVPINDVAIRFQMKFRDPQFTVSSQYEQQEIEYEGNVIILPEGTFNTKINLDGITFMLGAAFQF
ncbi:MAG: hypothetical protein IH819_04110 [Bacteroidetes bacterium]|nr:hypothetical protein [Bacteroidota bacterium]